MCGRSRESSEGEEAQSGEEEEEEESIEAERGEDTGEKEEVLLTSGVDAERCSSWLEERLLLAVEDFLDPRPALSVA